MVVRAHPTQLFSMQQLTKIFLGHTPKDQRDFLVHLLQSLRGQYPVLVIPCCGNFTLAQAGLLAGYAPAAIHCSDISLYSSLLGRLACGEDYQTLPYQVQEPYTSDYEGYEPGLRQVAYLLWLMKLAQLREDNPYEAQYREAMVTDKAKLVDAMAARLQGFAERYKGIQYEVRDMREVLRDDNPPEAVVLCNPPVFAKGYAKMFNFEGVIDWPDSAEEFNWRKEYWDLYAATETQQRVHIWYRYKNVGKAPQNHVVFAKEYKAEHFDYWLCTKPEALDVESLPARVRYKHSKNYAPLNAPLVPKDYRITENTKITFRKVSGEVSLYYRDLFAHKLGQTKAEIYYVMLLDGAVFGTVGFHLADVRLLRDDHVMEVFGFDRSLDAETYAHRLLMMAITCREFRDRLYADQRSNRYFEMRGFKTVCLAKYRKLKSSNGLLELVKRDKLPNGSYRLMYKTKWWDRTFQGCVQDWLTWNAKKKEGQRRAREPE